MGQIWGNEDCLFLNVYAPGDAQAGDALPVMVWIHGGGNSSGHSSFYDGAKLAQAESVVVVTLNYRLGPLGWFHHPALGGESAEDRSGNYGTLDLIAALRWVQGRIDAFGGDPAKVTIFGESAGGTNISSLLVAPSARGLFRGAIEQSGGHGSVSLAEASHLTDDPEPGMDGSSGEVALTLLAQGESSCDRACAKARLAETDPEALGQQLRALTVAELFALYGTDVLGPNNPAVLRDGAVLPGTPFLELFADPARSAPVPMIFGTNRDESKIFMAFDPRQVTRAFGLPLWPKDADRYNLMAEYSARAWKLRGVDEPARRRREAGLPVWTYRWDWDEQGRRLGLNVTQLLGAAHGLEIPFVFNHFDVGSQSGLLYHDDNAEGRARLARQMMGYWASFARDLDPGTGGGQGPRWQPFEDGTPVGHMRLDTAPGPEMTSVAETLEGLLADLAADPRLASVTARCAVLDNAFRYDGGDALETGRRVLGCEG
jgi:para-nitrobenzyl esterase